MLGLIASDNPVIAAALRNSLLSQGIECEPGDVVSMDAALEAVKRNDPAADLVFVVLSPDVDRSLRVLEQLRLRTRVRLCAVGAAHDPSQILRVVHVGPDDYLDEDGDLDEQVAGLVKRLRMTSKAAAQQGRLIAILSPSGGAGCTTIAANLAVALAAKSERCALCDLNLQTGDLAPMFNLKPTHSIMDLCGNLQHLDQAMFDKSLMEHKTGVHLLAAPRRYSDVQQVTSEAAEAIAEFACREFPFVIIDMEDFFHREQFRVLQLSSVILLVLRLDFISLRNVRRTLEYLERLGIGEDKFRLVVNQYGRPRDLTREAAEKALRRRLTFLLPDDPKTLVAAVNRGIPAMSDAPRSRFCRGIKKIADSLMCSDPEPDPEPMLVGVE